MAGYVVKMEEDRILKITIGIIEKNRKTTNQRDGWSPKLFEEDRVEIFKEKSRGLTEMVI